MRRSWEWNATFGKRKTCIEAPALDCASRAICNRLRWLSCFGRPIKARRLIQRETGLASGFKAESFIDKRQGEVVICCALRGLKLIAVHEAACGTAFVCV